MKKRKNAGRLILNVVCGLLVPAMIAVAAFIVYSKINNEPVFLFGHATFWVETGSMEKEIPARSYILVAKADGGDVRVGDVITFRSRDPKIYGAFNTHRVIGIDEETGMFRTQGDNNLVEDEYETAPEDVIGIYSRNLPVLSVLGRVLYSRFGIFAVLGVVIATVVLLFLPDMLKKTPEDAEPDEEEKLSEREKRIAEEIEKLKSGRSKLPENGLTGGTGSGTDDPGDAPDEPEKEKEPEKKGE